MRFTVVLFSVVLFSMVPGWATLPSSTQCSATPLQSFGGPVTLFAEVTTTNAGLPTGSVTFSEGSNVVGGGALGTSPVAQVVVSSFGVGFHTVTCTYSGDANYAPSSGQTTFTISPGNVVVKVTASSSTPAPPGTDVVLVVNVTSMAGKPTGGTITIYDGATVLFTGPLLNDDGELVFSTNKLAPGTHNITATYAGDPMFGGGQTLTPTLVVISRFATKTSLATDVSQASFGQSINATVQVTSTTAGTPTGTVTITENGATLGSGTLSGGQAKITISGLAPGAHNLVANYAGDSTFDSSSSVSVAETVLPGKLQVVSSASGATTVASDSLVSVFGNAIVPACGNVCVVTGNLPLAVTFKDSAGVQRTATVAYAANGQINVVAPSNMALGTATVVVTNQGTEVAEGTVSVAAVAPGLFTADNTPTGVAAAIVETVHADGTVTTQDVFQCNKNVCMTVPISLGSNGDQVFLILFSTGIRNAKQPVVVQIAKQNLMPAYAGPQPNFPGLDQINVALPATLKGTGNTTVSLVVGDQTSNLAALQVQ